MNPLIIEEAVRRALQEDFGRGDVTTDLVPGTMQSADGWFLVREEGVLCGTEVAARCFTMLDKACDVAFSQVDGVEVSAGAEVGKLRGPAWAILAAERVSLNFLQRLSGIATKARAMAKRAAALDIRVVETRKTTPGLRALEKYAVSVGGGHNHRFDLGGCVMLKDNHFALAGGDPGELVRAVKAKVSHTLKVIAEAGDPAMVEPLVEAGADVILLDNFSPPQVRAAVALIKGRALVELSGGIDDHNLDDYLIEGVNVISVGALTHSYNALDISLEL